MFEQYTECTRDLLRDAEHEARSLHHDGVSPHHIFLALLRRHGTFGNPPQADLRTYHFVRELVSRSMPPSNVGNSIPFTPASRELLSSAKVLSTRMGSPATSCAHVLIAYLDRHELLVAEETKNIAFDRDTLRTRATESLSSATVDSCVEVVTGQIKPVTFKVSPSNRLTRWRERRRGHVFAFATASTKRTEHITGSVDQLDVRLQVSRRNCKTRIRGDWGKQPLNLNAKTRHDDSSDEHQLVGTLGQSSVSLHVHSGSSETELGGIAGVKGDTTIDIQFNSGIALGTSEARTLSAEGQLANDSLQMTMGLMPHLGAATIKGSVAGVLFQIRVRTVASKRSSTTSIEGNCGGIDALFLVLLVFLVFTDLTESSKAGRRAS